MLSRVFLSLCRWSRRTMELRLETKQGKKIMAEKANIIDVLNGISQGMANVHDGASDAKGERINIGLKRDKELDISDRRMMDGFRIQFSGKNVILKYHAEVKLSEVRDNKFETNLESTIKAYTTNDNIMTSMRASEYAKTAPGGCALMTNHMDTVRVVNNPRSEGIF